MSKNKDKEQTTANQNVVDTAANPAETTEHNSADTTCDNVADDSANTPDNVSDNNEKQSDETKKIAELSAQCDELKDRYLRLQAEFDNYRKRTLKEKMDLITSGGEDVIKALLGVIDDLDRALAAIKSSNDLEALKAGVELIDTKLKEVLQGKGVQEIDAIGKELDTDLHEAVAKIPAPTPDAKGKIIDVVQKGYTLKDKVVRYAKVIVGE